jgi:glycosyltransferase involved in cell wall biosynthesis
MGLILIGADTQAGTVSRMLQKAGLRQLVYQAGDLSHDQFMTLISKVHLFVRTPAKDGVSSSVLEALSLRVPVIASENGARPSGVITFRANNADDLAEKLLDVWNNYDAVKSQTLPPQIQDTVEDEAELLLKLAL